MADDDNYLESCKKMFIELRDEINRNLDCIQREQDKIQAKRKEGETMGIIYECSDGIWAVEARTKPIRIFKDLPDDLANIKEDIDIEINYEDLDGFQEAVAFAQQKRRD